MRCCFSEDSLCFELEKKNRFGESLSFTRKSKGDEICNAIVVRRDR